MSIWKTQQGWRARAEVNGQRYPIRGTFKLKSEARAAVKAKRDEIKNRLQVAKTTGTSLDLYELTGAYLDWAETQFAYKTYAEKRHCLQRFAAFTGDIQPYEVTTEQVGRFIDERAREQSGYAANKDRKNLLAFFNWLNRRYHLGLDPVSVIENKPHTKKPRRLIPIQDIYRVIMAAPMPEKALMAAYWHTAGRRGEILRWTWADDVNLTERWVRLGTRKNKDGSMEYERLWMNKDLHSLLTEVWRKHRDPEKPYVFPRYFEPDEAGNNHKGEQRIQRFLMGYVRKWKTTKLEPREKRIPGLCEKAEVMPFGFHDIRHSASKYLNDLQKVGMKGVQRMLRHKRQTTTEIYLEGSYSELRPVMELLEWDSVMEALEKTPQKTPQNEIQGASYNS